MPAREDPPLELELELELEMEEGRELGFDREPHPSETIPATSTVARVRTAMGRRESSRVEFKR